VIPEMLFTFHLGFSSLEEDEAVAIGVVEHEQKK
jgi:hypothetical protein